LSWIPPPNGVIKINWDTAICKRVQKMGMSFLVRDSVRHVLASFCATKPHILDPGIVEAIFAWKMIEVVASLGYHSVLFEGDSPEIVQALKMEGVCLGWFG
jgi:hypothetical protein